MAGQLRIVGVGFGPLALGLGLCRRDNAGSAETASRDGQEIVPAAMARQTATRAGSDRHPR